MRNLTQTLWILSLTLLAACSAGPTPLPAKPNSGMSSEMQPGYNPENEPNLLFKGDAQAYLKGAWSEVVDWPFIAIHSALLPDGQVMTYGTGPDGTGKALSYDIWNPKQGLGQEAHNTLAVTTGTDIFCSAQVVVPGTGQMLITGGTVDSDDPLFDGSSADINFLDLTELTLSKSPRQLLEGRWYPTVTTLANGEVLVHGGRSAPDTPVITPEVYNPDTGWRNLTNAENSTAYYHYYYPWSFVAPDGRVFFTNNNPRMWFLDTQGTGELEFAGNRPDDLERGAGSAALYGEGKLLVAGGYSKLDGQEISTNTALLIDINGGEAKVSEAEPMTYARSEHDLTILPDGSVLASGGSAERNKWVDVALEPELWDPNTGAWELLKGNTTPRLYHSSTLLLPDGTLLMAGGGRPGPILNPATGEQLVNTNAELFYPPYLFAKDGSGELAARPQVLRLAQPTYAKSFSVDVDQDISRVTLVKAGSVTHALNMEQRFVELEFTQTGTSLSVIAPAKPELAPPGTYLLFVLDKDGVPSYGQLVALRL